MENIIEKLANDFAIPLRKQGALRLIWCEDAGRIVEACRASNLLILGIEAFTLADGMVVPETDLIADFSDVETIQWNIACIEAAQAADFYFSEAQGRDCLWFDFIIKDHGVNRI